MKDSLKHPPLSKEELVKRFYSKYSVPDSKIIRELILRKGYDRVSNIYLLIRRREAAMGKDKKISGTKIKNIYVFDKHFRNQLKEKLEIIEVFFTNQLINYIAMEAHKLCKNDNEYYLDHLFSSEIFESKSNALKSCKNAFKSKKIKCDNINEKIKQTEIWKYKGSFSVGDVRFLYKSLQLNHKSKLIEYLEIGKISNNDLSEALLAFNEIRNKFNHAEQIINTKPIRLPKWIEETNLSPHEKIALFLVSYTPEEFYKNNLKMILSKGFAHDAIVDFYNWKNVLSNRKPMII